MQFTSSVFNYFEPYVLDTFSVDVELSTDGIPKLSHFKIMVVRGLIVDLKCPWFLVCRAYDPAGVSADIFHIQSPFTEVLPLPEWCDEGRVWACPPNIDNVDEIIELAKKKCVGKDQPFLLDRIVAKQIATGRLVEFRLWLREVQRLNYKTSFEEKHTPMSTSEREILHSGDYELFSKVRGYSAEEIATFKEYLASVYRGVDEFGLYLDDVRSLTYDDQELDYQTLWLNGNHPRQLGETFESFEGKNPHLFHYLDV